jgi:hypothetical protein
MVVGLALVLFLMVDGRAATREFQKAANAVTASSAFLAATVLAMTERAIAIAQQRASGLGRLFLPGVVIGVILLVIFYS